MCSEEHLSETIIYEKLDNKTAQLTLITMNSTDLNKTLVKNNILPAHIKILEFVNCDLSTDFFFACHFPHLEKVMIYAQDSFQVELYGFLSSDMKCEVVISCL